MAKVPSIISKLSDLPGLIRCKLALIAVDVYPEGDQGLQHKNIKTIKGYEIIIHSLISFSFLVVFQNLIIQQSSL